MKLFNIILILCLPVISLAQTIKPDTICERLSYVKKINDKFYLLDLGGRYPDQKYTVVLKGYQDMHQLMALKDSQICVAGKKQIYKGKPQWVVSGRFKNLKAF